MEIKYYRKLSSSKDDNLRLQLATHASLQVNLCRFCSVSNIRLGWISKLKGFSDINVGWNYQQIQQAFQNIYKHHN